MKPSLLLRFFPPPASLTWQPVAVDLSDRSLKYCRLSFGGVAPRIELFGEKMIPSGLIEGGRIKSASEVVAVLKAAAAEFKSQHAIASLPEELGFTFLLSLPILPPAELRGAIELQLEEHIPLPAGGVVFDYEIVRKVGEQVRLVVTAFPREVVQAYVDVFAAAGLILVALEAETRAITRALCQTEGSRATLVVDLGKTHTSLIVAVGTLSVLTSTVPELGGDFFTKMVMRNSGLSETEAESLKNLRGLKEAGDSTMLGALVPALSALRDEIGKRIIYWNNQTETVWHGFPKIEKIILGGGQALMPGLVEYIADSLHLPTVVGVPPLVVEQAVRHAVVCGLALRFLELKP